MRKIFLALGMLINFAPSFAHASWGDGNVVYFWEDATHYGWSEVPDHRFGLPTVKVLKKTISIGEHCGRLVGRLMRTDSSSRRESIFLESTCALNGGKL